MGCEIKKEENVGPFKSLSIFFQSLVISMNQSSLDHKITFHIQHLLDLKRDNTSGL